MNNDQHPLLGALGLCRKAGKISSKKLMRKTEYYP